MEAKSQQNFYNKAAIVVISSKLFSLEHTLSWSGAKSHKLAHNNPLLPVYVVYSLHIVEYQLGTFSSFNSLDTCVQDMKSCPTHAVESSKIRNGFDMAGFPVSNTSIELVPHVLDRVKSGNKLGRGRLAMFCWFYIPRWCGYSEVLHCHLRAPCSGHLASPRVT